MYRPSNHCGVPAFGCAARRNSPRRLMLRRQSSIGFGPIAQFAPTTSAPSSRIQAARSPASSPRTVRPSSLKAIWATIGSSEASERAARIAASISSRREIVSMIRRSTPPSMRPAICSR